MNNVCSTCGTTLHSQISRDFGQCGACRLAYEMGEHRREPEAGHGGRQPHTPPQTDSGQAAREA